MLPPSPPMEDAVYLVRAGGKLRQGELWLSTSE